MDLLLQIFQAQQATVSGLKLKSSRVQKNKVEGEKEIGMDTHRIHRHMLSRCQAVQGDLSTHRAADKQGLCTKH